MHRAGGGGGGEDAFGKVAHRALSVTVQLSTGRAPGALAAGTAKGGYEGGALQAGPRAYVHRSPNARVFGRKRPKTAACPTREVRGIESVDHCV